MVRDNIFSICYVIFVYIIMYILYYIMTLTTTHDEIRVIDDVIYEGPKYEYIEPIVRTIEPLEIETIEEKEEPKKIIILQRVSFYNPCDPRQTDDSPCIFADNNKFRIDEYVIAVSPDLKKLGYTFGKRVRLEGLPNNIPNEFIIRDVTNRRYKNTVDIAYWIEEENLEIARRKAMKLGIFKDIKLCLL